MFLRTQPPLPLEAELILRATDPYGSGWIADINPASFIYPYQASYGAIGLACAYRATGHAKYLRALKRWVEWYATNVPSDDFMTDWDVNSDLSIVSKGAGVYDSSDAYIGLWGLCMWELWRLTGDASAIAGVAEPLSAQLTLLADTQQSDGLTWAKPDFHAKYLEDNLETLVGLRGIQEVAAAAGLTSLLSQVAAIADAMADGVSMMWNQETQTWDWAIDDVGTRTIANWSDESSRRQHIWSIVYGAAPTVDLASDWLDAYIAAFPDWATDITNGYEILPVVALRIAARESEALDAIADLRGVAASNGYAYPYNTIARGKMLIALEEAHEWPDLGLPILGQAPNLLNGICDTQLGSDVNSDGIPDGWNSYVVAGTGDTTVNPGHLRVSTPSTFAIIAPDVDIDGGKWYCLSAQIDPISVAGNVVVKVEWFDDANASVDPPYAYEYVVSPTVPIRIHVARIAPLAATKIRCTINIEGGGTADFSNVKLERQGAPTDWTA